MTSKTYVAELAVKVAQGDHDAFVELEGVAKPLLRSLTNRFSGYHHRFEYDDFYLLGMTGLYMACLTYNPRNPSFLDFAKVVMLREFWRELDYWNAEKRNAFNNDISYDQILEDSAEQPVDNFSLFENAADREFREHIDSIIDECFNAQKAQIIRSYLFQDMRVADIARVMELKYKNVYSTVKRGMEKIQEEYSSRFLDSQITV